MTQETDQKVVADVLSNPELMEVLQHPWVLQTLAHYAKKTFHSPDTRYGFWANNLRPEIKDKAPVIDNDGKPIYRHHGHENLREFDDTSKASGPHGEVDKNSGDHRGIISLNGFESQTGFKIKREKILDLSEIEKSNLLPAQKQAICALQSLLYAKAATDPVITSVQGANPNSFFRTTEIYSIMNNPDIKNIQILEENMEQAKASPNGIGTRTLNAPVEKKQAYHQLRDEWAQSAIVKYKEVQDNLAKATATEKPALVTALISAREALLKEQAIAEHMSTQTHPFTKNGFYDKSTAPQYDDADQDKERNRCAAIKQSLKNTVGLTEKIKQTSEANVKSFVDELGSPKMSDMDAILYVGTKIAEGMMKGQGKGQEYAKSADKIQDVIESLKRSTDKSLEAVSGVVAAQVEGWEAPKRAASAMKKSASASNLAPTSIDPLEPPMPRSNSAPALMPNLADSMRCSLEAAKGYNGSALPNNTHQRGAGRGAAAGPGGV